MKYLIIIIVFVTSSAVYGQKQNKVSSHSLSTNKKQVMDLSKLTNKQVKQAIDAWQKGDGKAFLSFFVPKPILTDDGSPRDFGAFLKTACGHERFTSIDIVGNNGLDVFGNFHTESWGDFKTYFKFHLNKEGKFDRLDIGQAKYSLE